MVDSRALSSLSARYADSMNEMNEMSAHPWHQSLFPDVRRSGNAFEERRIVTFAVLS